MNAMRLIVSRSLIQHKFSTVVTALSVGLASGLVMSVFSLNTQVYQSFTASPGFDAVLGARGSATQLVLNTVFHLETSPGNIPWATYMEMKDDPRIELAIPYALGDNFNGFRIVGTTDELFSTFEYQEGKKLHVQSEGQAYYNSYARPFDSRSREAVIGSIVAKETGLRYGSKFSPYHGLEFNPDTKHDEEYVVVGVLETTNTPNDRVIWIPIEGIFRMGGHILRGTGDDYVVGDGQKEIPDEHKEVSAVMLKFESPQLGFSLMRKINNQGNVATLAWPVKGIVLQVLSRFDWVHQVLRVVAYLVVAVAAGSILASLYNSMNERRRQFAILRALGARKSTVFFSIVLEAAAIAALGSLIGVLVHFLVMQVSAEIIRDQTGVVLSVWALDSVLLYVPLGMTILGALSGLLPAFKAYSTDVASHLIPRD